MKYPHFTYPIVTELYKYDFSIDRQKEDFLEFWFSDGLNEEMWEVIYKCGQNSLDLIEAFLKDQSVWPLARTVVSKALIQIALHNPDKKEEIINVYKRVITATIPHVKYKNKSRGHLLEVSMRKDDAKDVIAWYVSDLADLQDQALYPY